MKREQVVYLIIALGLILILGNQLGFFISFQGICEVQCDYSNGKFLCSAVGGCTKNEGGDVSFLIYNHYEGMIENFDVWFPSVAPSEVSEFFLANQRCTNTVVFSYSTTDLRDACGTNHINDCQETIKTNIIEKWESSVLNTEIAGVWPERCQNSIGYAAEEILVYKINRQEMLGSSYANQTMIVRGIVESVDHNKVGDFESYGVCNLGTGECIIKAFDYSEFEGSDIASFESMEIFIQEGGETQENLCLNYNILCQDDIEANETIAKDTNDTTDNESIRNGDTDTEIETFFKKYLVQVIIGTFFLLALLIIRGKK